MSVACAYVLMRKIIKTSISQSKKETHSFNLQLLIQLMEGCSISQHAWDEKAGNSWHEEPT